MVFSLYDQLLKVSQPPMAGKHQVDNLAAALAALVLMNPSCLEKEAKIAAAIGRVQVPGRLQSIQTSPTILIDVGHNALAAEVVARYLNQNKKADVVCVLAMLADKPAESVARALNSVCKHWLCADSHGERGQSGELLAGRVKAVLPTAKVNSFKLIDAALEKALSLAGKSDTVLVFGSFPTAADTFTWQQNRLKSPH